MESKDLRIDLEKVLQRRELEPAEELGGVLARLDARRAEAGLPERLRHYLERRSYVKALEWLDHPDTPHRP